MTQTPPQKTGLLDPAKTYADVGADISTVSRAVTKRWPVDDKTRAVLVDRLKRIALFDANSRRATRAAEVLVRMEGQNQSDEHATAAPGNASPNVVIFLPDNGRGDGQQRQHSQQRPPQNYAAPALSEPSDVESIPLGPRIPATQPSYREQAERTKAAQAGRPAPANEPPPPATAEQSDVQQTPTAGPVSSRQPDDDGQ